MSKLQAQFMATGRLAGLPVVDHHLHNSHTARFATGGADFADVANNLQRRGVGCGVVSDINCYPIPYEGNRRVEALARRWPGLLRGAVFLAANRPGGWQQEVARCAATGLFTGFKLHPSLEGRALDDPFYRGVYATAAQMQWPVLLHTWGEAEVRLLAEMADAYPDTIFLAGHCGGERAAMLLTASLAATRQNYYLDLTCTWPHKGITEQMVQACGAEKILFGSDAMWNSLDAAVGRVVFADISEGEKALILGGNALRLYPGLTV